ncbi:MAG: polysaccharide biosynthesis/export family protein [Xanthomonadales bacterium]|nr:polysaccharide biosynthesis/export family protein [Xanthomonadales bacterium]
MALGQDQESGSPVPGDLYEYHIGPGDVVSISVFGEADLSPQVRVDEGGTIQYPFLGQLSVAGLSTLELKDLLMAGLKPDYLVDPKIAVSVATYRPFYVNGEVNDPGGYPYEPGMTVQMALALAGGLTDRASVRKVFLQREGQSEESRQRVDMDARVGPGDIITIEQSFF